MELYKFRSFESDYIEDILSNNRFHLSIFKDLNDPMEGYFQHFRNKNEIKPFIDEKSEYKICSFSKTYQSILLWTFYADVFKGIAIEITLDLKNNKNLNKVEYCKCIPDLNSETKPIDVLKKKVNLWSYEKEYRAIAKSDQYFIPIGKITGILLGLRINEDKIILVENLASLNKIPVFKTDIDFKNNKIVKL